MAQVGFLAAVLLLCLFPLYVYLRANFSRKRIAQDHQRLFSSSRSFHVLVLYKVHSGNKVLDSARHFSHQILAGGDASLVYAGQVAFSIDSDQLGPARWDGLLLFELRSRERFNAAYTERFRRGRSLFASSYIAGMQRSALSGALMPWRQLSLKWGALMRGQWSPENLVSLPELKSLPQYDKVRGYLRRLTAVEHINGEALIAYSLGKRSRSPQNSDTGYDTRRLLTRLARDGMGPLHIGRFTRIEQNALFDSVYALQYAGPKQFSELLQSQFYQTVADHKSLADSLVIATVPITDRL